MRAWIPWTLALLFPTSLPILSLGLAAHTALDAYRFDQRYARDDYRGLARYIETQERPGDAIILNAPGQTEILSYYYKGQEAVHPLPRQRPLNESATAQDLDMIAASSNRVWAVLWGQQESDPNSFIERWLDRRGYKTADRWFGGVRLVLYSVPRPGEELRLPLEARMGDYARLRAASFPGVPPSARTPLVRGPSGGVIPLTLHWEAISPTPRRYKVFVHLLGPNDTLWGQHDAEPAGGSRFTTDWQPGEAISDNHGLPVPPGTPPGEYEIEVGLYDMATGQRLPVFDSAGGPAGDRVVLKPVEVTRPDRFPSIDTLAIERPLEGRFQDVSLMGYELFKLGTGQGDLDFRQGDMAHLALFWLAGASENRRDYPIRVALLDTANSEVAQYTGTAVGNYPTSSWTTGEVVRDLYKIPLAMPAGTYRLAVYIASGAQGPLINPAGPGLKVVDGKLLLTELQVK